MGFHMNTKRILMTITIFIVALALLMDPSASIAQDPQGGNEPTPTPQEGETGSLGEENDPTVLAPENATALVSSSFTYQGQLRHEGKAVNGNCDFTWNIFATNVITTPLATDSDTNVPVKNGLFFATINVHTSVIDGNARFLEILVRCPTGEGAYTALSPRQELQAAPYALGLRMPFSHTFSDAMTTNPIFAVSNINTSTSQPSIQGTSAGGNGVSGVSTGGSYADNGVYGETNSTDTAEAGVKGRSTGSAAGGYFSSTNGHGVYGKTDSPTQ